MPKILIVYDSKSGNTETMALAVAKGAFTSSGGTGSGAETTLLSIVQAMLIHGMIVQGRADDKHYGVAVTGAPKKRDLAECEKLGKRVAALVLKLNPS